MKLAASAAFVAALAAASAAHAVVSPFGGPAVGADPLGDTWKASGSSWGEPGLGLGSIAFNPNAVSNHKGTFADRFSFIFLEGVNGVVDQTPAAGPGGFETTTRFSTGGVLWNTQFVGGNKVVFTAPTGTYIHQGQNFFVNIAFTGPVDTNSFSFAGLWTDDAGGVPEPTTWALMLGGFGLAGVALRRRRVALAA